jgi:hypothetical protein
MSSRSNNWRVRYLVLCLAAAVNTEAQTPPAPVTAESASLSGTVINSITGAPVPRAHVTIRSTGEFQRIFGAMTNGEGKFAMTKAPPGHYSFSAEHLGFVMPSSQDASPADLTLGPGEKKEDLKLTLVPTGAIGGRVLDATGEPVEGVSVTAEGPWGPSAAPRTTRANFASAACILASTASKPRRRLRNCRRKRVRTAPRRFTTPPLTIPIRWLQDRERELTYRQPPN